MAKKGNASGPMLRLTLTRSPIGNTKRHKDIIRTLGLKKMHQSVERQDSPSLRGMLLLVGHLVTVEEVKG